MRQLLSAARLRRAALMKRILSVDDSASVRQMVSFTLRKDGYEVGEACDGRDALAKAGQSRFDMIITDLNMPNLDGIQMIAAVRALHGYAFTPILMLTTESQPEKKMPDARPVLPAGS
jgi:two-component system chemotaxis response regulator CheY